MDELRDRKRSGPYSDRVIYEMMSGALDRT